MRSFLLASAALCLTAIVSGCDAPVEPAKPATPPAASSTPEPANPGNTKEGKMEGPAPAPVEKPAEPPK